MTDIDTLRRHREALGVVRWQYDETVGSSFEEPGDAQVVPALAWALAKLDEEIVRAETMSPLVEAKRCECDYCAFQRSRS